jgi:glycosyltransferase involved in cell wall biosynthesis
MNGRLLFVVNDAGFFLSHRLPVALAARRAGLDVHVAIPDDANASGVRVLSFAVHTFPLSRRGTNPLRELRSLGALVRLYRRVRPTLVHHVTIKPVIYGSLAARLAGVPAVVNAVTGLGWVFIARSVRVRALKLGVKRAYRLAFRHPNMRVIFQNPDDRAAFVSEELLAPAQAALIRGSGVDMAAFHPTPEPTGEPVVVLAGRMLWDKGVGEFVEAARTLRAQGVRGRFVLVGASDPGNPAAIPSEQLAAWRESGSVEWWGQRSDMTDVLAQCHVACLPSYREGVPKVLIEAAASGRPLVATDVPGCREIVRPGHSGVLVPARDAAALAEALRGLLEDAALRAQLGAGARALAQAEFSQERVVEQTLAVYQDLLSRCEPAVPVVEPTGA